MCGIAGIISFNKEPVDNNRLQIMRDMLSHRGPDDADTWLGEGVGLAHRRLSILDLSEAGRQPFFSAGGHLVMVYNGEVYNFRELRRQLEAKGYRFQTETDTEVVLACYEHFGLAAFSMFNGMFAIAIWNRQTQEFLLVRDRAGVKPVYYHINARELYFASEPKALIAAGISAEIDEASLDELLAYRYLAGENTVFRHIKALCPGYYMQWKPGERPRIARWWHLGEQIKNHPPIENPKEWFAETFASAVNYRMVSDVPVGVLLSAGLDSSSVAQVLHNAHYPSLQTFTIGFHESEHDESALAQRFCNELGFGFNKLYLGGEHLAQCVEDASFYHDQPLIHFSDPHLLAISRLAKQKVSVLLSGEGADEIMGGYVRYKTFQHTSLWPLLRFALPLANYLRPNPRYEKLRRYLAINNPPLMQLSNASNVFSNEWIDTYKLWGLNLLPPYRIALLQEAREVYPDNLLRQLLYLDQHTYLPSLNERNDRATMGASIECREPFMDYRLMTGLGTLPDKWLFQGKKNKFLLFDTIGRQLPDYIRTHRKVGLSVPWPEIIKTDPYFRESLETLPQSELFAMGILGKLDLAKVKDEFLKFGKHQPIIVQLVFFNIWYNTYFKRIQRFSTAYHQ